MAEKKHIENVIIGRPIAEPEAMFAFDKEDWEKVEQEKTATYEGEPTVAHILVHYGMAPSVSEVRRNRKELLAKLDKPDFLTVKYGKAKLWILVGEVI